MSQSMIKALEERFEQAPRNTSVAMLLGNAQEQEGLTEQALQTYQKVLEIKEDHQGAVDAIYRLSHTNPMLMQAIRQLGNIAWKPGQPASPTMDLLIA